MIGEVMFVDAVREPDHVFLGGLTDGAGRAASIRSGETPRIADKDLLHCAHPLEGAGVVNPVRAGLNGFADDLRHEDGAHNRSAGGQLLNRMADLSVEAFPLDHGGEVIENGPFAVTGAVTAKNAHLPPKGLTGPANECLGCGAVDGPQLVLEQSLWAGQMHTDLGVAFLVQLPKGFDEAKAVTTRDFGPAFHAIFEPECNAMSQHHPECATEDYSSRPLRHVPVYHRGMTIPLDKLKAIKIIVSHERCPDGVAAALILKDVLPDAKVIFCQYNSPEHETMIAQPGMVFADFSPHKSRIEEFVGVGAVVLDHHRTAKEVVAAFGELGVFADEKAEPGVSGATLAYREVWYPLWVNLRGRITVDPDTEDGLYSYFVRKFAEIAGIRDTWQKKNPLWEPSCIQASALFFAPQEDMIASGLRQIYADWATRYEWVGAITNAKHRRRCERAVREGYRHTTAKGNRIIMFQGTKLSSDAAEAPGAENADIICGFDVIYEAGQVKYLYSTRSRTNFDCSALAKTYGGGGHRAAAGFNAINPASDPYRRFVEMVQTFEDEQDGRQQA